MYITWNNRHRIGNIVLLYSVYIFECFQHTRPTSKSKMRESIVLVLKQWKCKLLFFSVWNRSWVGWLVNYVTALRFSSGACTPTEYVDGDWCIQSWYICLRWEMKLLYGICGLHAMHRLHPWQMHTLALWHTEFSRSCCRCCSIRDERCRHPRRAPITLHTELFADTQPTRLNEKSKCIICTVVVAAQCDGPFIFDMHDTDINIHSVYNNSEIIIVQS